MHIHLWNLNFAALGLITMLDLGRHSFGRYFVLSAVHSCSNDEFAKYVTIILQAFHVISVHAGLYENGTAGVSSQGCCSGRGEAFKWQVARILWYPNRQIYWETVTALSDMDHCRILDLKVAAGEPGDGIHFDMRGRPWTSGGLCLQFEQKPSDQVLPPRCTITDPCLTLPSCLMASIYLSTV